MKNGIKIIFIIALSILSGNTGFSQAKKPTLMVVPSDVWCTKNGYMADFDNQGTKFKIPDYKKAFQENSDLLLAFSKIIQLMA